MEDRKEFRGLVIWVPMLLFFVIGQLQGTPVSIRHVKVSRFNYRVLLFMNLATYIRKSVKMIQVDEFVAGKPLTEEEFNTPPKYCNLILILLLIFLNLNLWIQLIRVPTQFV